MALMPQHIKVAISIMIAKQAASVEDIFNNIGLQLSSSLYKYIIHIAAMAGLYLFYYNNVSIILFQK